MWTCVGCITTYNICTPQPTCVPTPLAHAPAHPDADVVILGDVLAPLREPYDVQVRACGWAAGTCPCCRRALHSAHPRAPAPNKQGISDYLAADLMHVGEALNRKFFYVRLPDNYTAMRERVGLGGKSGGGGVCVWGGGGGQETGLPCFLSAFPVLNAVPCPAPQTPDPCSSACPLQATHLLRMERLRPRTSRTTVCTTFPRLSRAQARPHRTCVHSLACPLTPLPAHPAPHVPKASGT